MSSGCLSRGTFFCPNGTYGLVWRVVGWWWRCQGGAEGGEGKGGEWVPFLDTPPMSDYPTCGRTLPTPPPTPLVQTRKKNQINKEKNPKKKTKKNHTQKLRKGTETKRSPNCLALRSAGKVCEMEKQALLRRPMLSYQNLMKKWAKRVPDSQRQASALEAEFTPSMTAPGPV